MPGGEWNILLFKYERLGVFYFLCGFLGHSDKFCDQRFTRGVDDGTRLWGVELQADSRRQNSGDGCNM